jgi:hypothetical protein
MMVQRRPPRFTLTLLGCLAVLPDLSGTVFAATLDASQPEDQPARRESTPAEDNALSPEAPPLSAKAAGRTGAPADLEAQSAAEAAALDREIAKVAGTGEEFGRLNLYGFADFTYTRYIGDYSSTPATFAVGNVNLYLASELGDGWRSLVEVRYLYLPNGATSGGELGYLTDTTVNDYTDFSRPMQWGGISIQRAWIERTFHKLLTVRVGHWLTPYGIWNVDHGSPVVIGVTRPYIIGEALLPASQTGIEIYGTCDINTIQLGYHLTLSNGRGPASTIMDLDDNKAVGGRFFLRFDSAGFGTLTAGGAFYHGRYTSNHAELGVDAKGTPTFVPIVDSQFDELSLSADLKWQWRGLLVQGELIENEVAYLPGGRTKSTIAGLPPSFDSDFRRWGVYSLVGYRLPFFGVMPYAGGGYYKEGSPSWVPGVADFWFGLNLRPTPRVVLKLQYTHAHFYNTTLSGVDMRLITAQTAWSF